MNPQNRIGLLRRLAAFLKDHSGATAVTFGIVLPGMVGLGGLGVETAGWYRTRLQMQAAADAGAVAGAIEKVWNHSDAQVLAAVQRAVQRNGVDLDEVTLTLTSPPTSGARADDPDAVEVVVAQAENRMLSTLFLHRDPTIRVRAVGAVEAEAGSACVLALDGSAASALEFGGSTVIALGGCLIASNSTHSEAITLSGAASVSAESLVTPGGFVEYGSSDLTLNREAQIAAPPLTDPYADRAIPSTLPPCNFNNKRFNNSNGTGTPGVYCGGMEFGANSVTTLQPGTYYINQGDFRVVGNATIRCDCTVPGSGISFVLTSTGQTRDIGSVTLSSNSNIQLRAPTDGTYAYPGQLFYQDRRADPTNRNTINGGAGLVLTGALYFPAQEILFSGNSSATPPGCTQVVGRLVTFTGNSSLNNEGCEEAGVEPIQTTSARLVE